MPLDPALRVMLDQIAAMESPPPHELTPAEVRDAYRLLNAADGDQEPVDTATDTTVPGPAGDIPVRVYRPAGVGERPLPVLIWFHGGGFVIGDLDTADRVVRRLANRSGALAVSVDYRLAPEHRFPAAIDDCWAAVGWLAEHAGELGGDSTRMAVGGDSAGGNAATFCARRAAAEGRPPLAHQLLVYPWCDLTMSHPSIEENGDGYLLTASTLRWFADHYLGDADPKDPQVSPLFADDLSGTGPATIISAGFDPFRDENAAYAERLAEAGVPVEHRRFDDMIHGFVALTGITAAATEAIAWAGARLAAGFQGTSTQS